MNTPFWEHFLCENSYKHPRLLGLLYGYGLHNTLLFEWKYNLFCNRNTQNCLDQIKPVFSENPLPYKEVFKYPAPFSHINFPLPPFASFQIDDPNIKKYSEEREKIMAYYKDKNFVQTTLDILSAH